MTARRPYTRHGLTAAMVRVRLAGFTAIDRRTAGARAMLDFRRDLVSALGGEADLSPQRRLVDMAARAALLLDHVDFWIVGQRSVVNARTRALLPVLTQRIALAEHLARLLDRLGLDRAPRKLPALAEYLGSRGGENRAPGGAPGPTQAASEAPAADAAPDDHATDSEGDR